MERPRPALIVISLDAGNCKFHITAMSLYIP